MNKPTEETWKRVLTYFAHTSVPRMIADKNKARTNPVKEVNGK